MHHKPFYGKSGSRVLKSEENRRHWYTPREEENSWLGVTIWALCHREKEVQLLSMTGFEAGLPIEGRIE